MPTLTIAAAGQPVTQTRRRVVLDNGVYRFPLAITTPEAQMPRIGSQWTEINRPGDFSLARRVAVQRRQIRFDAILLPLQGLTPVTVLNRLEAMSNSDRPVSIGSSSLEAGKWHLTGIDTPRVMRREIGNEPSQMSVTLQWTEWVDEHLTVVPSATRPAASPTTSSPTKTPGASRSTSKTRSYTVRSGDTLSRIAVEFYHDANLWPKIATANKLRNPNRIYPGQRLVIP